MASRMKEDEKNERIIRGLLKLPENRRCINCNSLGPQYVCTNFWTFVCTNCSGIHREFTHRVKSVSMAKFTTPEVSALQAGGNERAREVYLKELDPQRQSIPDSSNVMRLRDFIKHVYVDRRYTGERPVDKPPRIRMSDREDTYESRKVDPYRGDSRSPPFENQRYNERPGIGERNDDRSYRYSYDERKSPGSARGEFRKSPVRFEVVDDRRRDDRFGDRRRHEDHRYSDGDMVGGVSPNRLKETDTSSPPMVRPVREILGKDTPPLRIGEPPRANGGKAADGSTLTQRVASSNSLGSIDGSSVELRKSNSSSLIDFNAVPEPPATTGPSAEPPKKPDIQPDMQPKGPSVDDNNWANFDFSSQTSVPSSAPAPASAPASSRGHSETNTLESLLFELSTPAPAPVGNTDMLPARTSGAPTTAPVDYMLALPTSAATPPSVAVGNTSKLPFSGGASAASPLGNMSIYPNNSNASAAAPVKVLPMSPTSGASAKANDGGQWQSMQQPQPSLFAPMNTPSSVQASNSQSWNSSLAQNAQGPNSAVGQVSQIASRPTPETSGGVASQPPASEVKSAGRKALPEDLFAVNYSAAPVAVRGWQPGLSPGIGYGMQYPNAVPMPTFPQSSKPANPFDLSAESALVHSPSFPSMSSLQGALPNVVAPSGLLRSSSLGTMSPQWMPTQSPSYVSSMQSPSYVSSAQSPSYASGLVPGAYVGQQMHGNMPHSGHQGSDSSFGGGTSFFGNLNTNQQQVANRFSQPSTPSSFSPLGGNPFG